MSTSDDLVADQIAYYRARADEYDEWWFRQGRYSRGADKTAVWERAVSAARSWLVSLGRLGKTLEIAAGTGLWTEHLARQADSVHAVDASTEVLARNRARIKAAGLADCVTYEIIDVFSWQPTNRYDTVAFTFWLSHVPAERFASFWQTVGDVVAPGGRAIFIDSLYNPDSGAVDHLPRERGSETMTRRLNDGREWTIVKINYDPADLITRLAGIGWQADVSTSGSMFLLGTALAPPPA